MGKWYCEALHPELDLTCRLDPNLKHEFHVAFDGDEETRWLNADYTPPPPPSPSDKRMKTKLMEMAREISRPQSSSEVAFDGADIASPETEGVD